jgi:hypothetical protein
MRGKGRPTWLGATPAPSAELTGPSAGYRITVGRVRDDSPGSPSAGGVDRLESTKVYDWVPTAHRRLAATTAALTVVEVDRVVGGAVDAVVEVGATDVGPAVMAVVEVGAAVRAVDGADDRGGAASSIRVDDPELARDEWAKRNSTPATSVTAHTATKPFSKRGCDDTRALRYRDRPRPGCTRCFNGAPG